MNRQNIFVLTSAVVAISVAVASYLYLAPALFYLGLSRFYDIAPTVPEQCTNVVADAAVAFSGIFDYVALVIAAVFLVLGLCLAWWAFSSRTTGKT